MKIKLDENLPARVALELTRLGHDVHTIPQEGLAGVADSSVWRAAQTERRFLITQDFDFSDIRRFRPGSHAGLLLIRLRFPARELITRRLLHIFESEHTDSWNGCVVVATDSKLRIRRPVD